MSGSGWPRASPTTPTSIRQNSFPKNPSLTISRTINLYPLSNYTFGTKVVIAISRTILVILFLRTLCSRRTRACRLGSSG